MSVRGPFRLAAGGRVDRGQRLQFSFDRRTLHGHPGDTLASALLANGIRLVARSFKYHRPRGVVTAGIEEPNAMVQLVGNDDEPNVPATVLPLRDGLSARSINRWPTLRWDLGAINDRLAPMFPAGFYYKTFVGGLGWDFYAWFIRRLAGLSRSPRIPGPHRYEKRFHHCDVLVAGAGPAGLAAALVAARSGARVLIADEQPEPGGKLLDGPARIGGGPAGQWVDDATSELDSSANVVRLPRATVAGYHDHNFLTVLERQPARAWLEERLWKVRARQVVLATGAIERPLVFADNDRPGVMLVHAARAYAHRYGVLVGHRAVVVTNNSSAYEAAFDLSRSGLSIALIADLRERVPESLLSAAGSLGIEVRVGHGVVAVHGAGGVTAARVAPRTAPRRDRTIDCDVILASGGWSPAVHLHSQSGGKPSYDPGQACFVPGASVQAERSAGASRGTFDLAGCIAEGEAAGTDATLALGLRARPLDRPEIDGARPLDIEPCWELPRTSRSAKAFVDYQNDVTTDDLRLAVREGFTSVELLKRYTTTGMGTDQGKLGNANAIGILAGILGLESGEVGTTTFRFPYSPVSFGAIAGNDLGALLIPSRRTPITQWNEANGAKMFEAGAAYRRPSYYRREGESAEEAIQREALACRTSVGIYDGSPLGKFELQGPDVVALLERVYTNRWADLEIDRGRFGWMLREDGRLLDDGVTFRLAEDRFWMFCGTGAAAHAHAHLERLLQLEWPELRVFLTVVTAQWANICVCGPRARDVLTGAGTDIDLGAQAFPFMALRHGTVSGIRTRVARVGYTGELSFELNVRAREGLALWEALLRAGKQFDITPVGSEASLVMRCEKGFVSAGYEGDGIVNPYDAGLAWMVDETKPDFIGKRMLVSNRNEGGKRPEVIGLLPVREEFVPPDGAPLLDPTPAGNEPNVVGYVSQGCRSPSLGRSIALAVLDDGRARMDGEVIVAAIDERCPARVTRPCFVDPQGYRMRGTT